MIYLFGAGGHGKVVADILECMGETILGVFDDHLEKKVFAYPTLAFPGSLKLGSDALIVSIGNNAVRFKVVSQLAGYDFSKAIHPSAVVSKHGRIDVGTVVVAGALINADAVIGAHVIINSHASVDHDCRVGDFAHISPNATLCGAVQVGFCTHIGTGAVVLPGVKIGSHCTVGAGAIVTYDLPDHVTAVGNPARIL